MQMKTITLALFIALSAGHAQAQVQSNSGGDLAEWELLKAYLSEVEKRSDLEIQMEFSDYKLRKTIFKEESRRWWELYKEGQRKQKINEYWKRFREGEAYAQNVVSTSVGNYCKLLGQVDVSKYASPVEDANMSVAFERGFKTAYPECSIPNLDQFLRDSDKKISSVEAKLKSIQLSILASKPTEKEIEVIYAELKNKYVEVVKGHLAASQEKLEKSFALPSTELNRLMESAKILAQSIDCANLKSRAGIKYNCTAQVLEASVKLGTASTYRVLKGEQETGAFQSRLYFGQLFEAISVYLKEVNPNDQVVRYLANDLSVSLTKLQQESDRRIADARVLIAEDFFDKIRALRIDTIDLNRGVFSKATMLGLVNDLMDVKSALESYARFDMSSQYEEEQLQKVINHYSSTLRAAANLKAEVQLPKRNIIVTLEDETTSDVVTLEAMPLPPKAYLLGVSPDEVRDWIEFLAIE